MQLFCVLALSLVHVVFTNGYAVNEVASEYSVGEKKELVFIDDALVKTTRTFLYATCDDSRAQNEMNCTFVMDKYLYTEEEIKSGYNAFTCNFPISTSANRRIYKNLNLEKFEYDNIFFSWTEYDTSTDTQFVKYSLVFMPLCQIIHTGETLQSYYNPVNFVMYRDTVDVLDYSSQSCGSKVCRISHTWDGKPKTDAATPFPDSLRFWHVFPVEYDGPGAGFFAFSENKAYHISQSGNVTHMLTVPADSFIFSRIAYERLGLCYPLNEEENKYQCTQIDSFRFLKTLMNTTVELKKNEKLFNIFNLASDGMLLLTGANCKTTGITTCSSFTAFKVRENGNQEERYSVPVPDFGCEPESLSVAIRRRDSTDQFHFAGVCDGKIKYYRTEVTSY